MLRRLAQTWVRGAIVLGAVTAGCKHKSAPTPPAPAPAADSALAPPPSGRSVERDEMTDAAASAVDGGALRIDAPIDVLPAGPSTASSFGIVITTRDDDVVLAALPSDDKSAIKPVEREGRAFSPYARGPSIAGDYAYWVSKGRLVRRRVQGGGALEVLTEGARDGTRVAALDKTSDYPALAVYIANPSSPNGDPVAMLWSDGLGIARISPEGAAASSASLTRVADFVLVTYVEGRTGMSPFHAREVRAIQGKLKLEDDVVVWVGGSAQAMTEVVSGAFEGDAWAFIPLERDITRFGLAEIQIGQHPTMGAPVTWRAYPNGLDPAPIATAEACGSTLLVHARPEEAKPGSRQELHLSRLGRDGLENSEIVARARAFSNVSISPIRDAALVVYVAGRRTWAATVHCAGPDAKK